MESFIAIVYAIVSSFCDVSALTRSKLWRRWKQLRSSAMSALTHSTLDCSKLFCNALKLTPISCCRIYDLDQEPARPDSERKNLLIFFSNLSQICYGNWRCKKPASKEFSCLCTACKTVKGFIFFKLRWIHMLDKKWKCGDEILNLLVAPVKWWHKSRLIVIFLSFLRSPTSTFLCFDKHSTWTIFLLGMMKSFVNFSPYWNRG